MNNPAELTYDEPTVSPVLPTRIEDIWGMIRTVSVAPDAAPVVKPRKFNEQFLIYKNGATLRFYWFDLTNKTWHYVTATA